MRGIGVWSKKFIVIIIKNIKVALQEQLGILILLILSLGVTFFTFFTLVGSIKYTIESTYDWNMFNTFTIEFDKTSSKSNQIEKFFDNENIQKEIKTALLMNIEVDRPLLIGWFGEDNENRWFVQDEGSFFTESDVLNAKAVTVISQEIYPNADFDFSEYPYTIKNLNYQIIGLADIPTNLMLFTGTENLYYKYIETDDFNFDVHNHDTDDCDIDNHYHGENNFSKEDIMMNKLKYQVEFIPYTTYLNNEYTTKILRLEIPIKNNEERQDISKKLSAFFPNTTIYEPELPEQRYTNDFYKMIFIAAVLCIISLINIVSLGMFWLNRNRKIFMNYYICGASSSYVFRIIAILWVLIVVISFMIAHCMLVVTRSLAELFLYSLNYTVVENLTILFGGYILSILFIALPVKNFIRQINSAYKE